VKIKAASKFAFYFKWTVKSSLGPIFWPLSRAQLRKLVAAHPDDSAESIKAIAYQYKGFGYYKRLKPFQVEYEYTRFIEFVRGIKPKVVVEIGTADGGTLLAWSRIASETVVSVDQPLNSDNWGYAPVRQRLYKEMCADRTKMKMHTVFGDSHKESTKKLVQDCLAGRKVDFLFIDGDHSYEGVKRDYELFKDLVRPGGYIAFHDVVPHTRPRVFKSEVDKLWDELKPSFKHTEIIADPKQGWAGIGVLHTPG
jgi:cephalosporin hydroxylase